ncbi:heterokaryon incompatibility protein-domain-containing protein [Paraphoma chrysanthemicola]|nr:heterokaryon incompatibility protein-domain-containing protein [Paraphoma chrysanthemicola]
MTSHHVPVDESRQLIQRPSTPEPKDFDLDTIVPYEDASRTTKCTDCKSILSFLLHDDEQGSYTTVELPASTNIARHEGCLRAVLASCIERDERFEDDSDAGTVSDVDDAATIEDGAHAGDSKEIMCKRIDLMRDTSRSKFNVNALGPYFWVRDLELVKRDGMPGKMGLGRVIESEWIDVDIMRRWVRMCVDGHGEACSQQHLIERLGVVYPARLVDVLDMCLVEAHADMEYITLSYVWGIQPFFKSMKENVEKLYVKNTLTQGNEIVLPKTIKHAMEVVRILGERYIWIDALCIVQDDEAGKDAEIRNMGGIYARSKFTIVAAGGEHADAGLDGLRGTCGPLRGFQQRVLDVGDGMQIIQRAGAKVDESRWWHRAWTLQEHFFSSRRLVFGQEIVGWDCECARWREDVIETDTKRGRKTVEKSRGRVIENTIDDARLMFYSPFPDLLGLLELIIAYNQKDLTYNEDIFKAFEAPMLALQYNFQGGFLCGLPVMFLDAALLWQAGRNESLVRRRPKDADLDPDSLPSWSWVGWKGKLDSNSWVKAMDYIEFSPRLQGNCFQTERVIPLVEWRSHEYKDGPGTSLHSTWYEFRDAYLNHETETPPGWTRNERTDSVLFQWHATPEEDEIPKWHYTHEADEDWEFWYPIPLNNADGPSLQYSTARFLSCQTQRTWLHLGGYIQTEYMYEKDPTLVSLLDGDGMWAGALKLHDEQLFATFSVGPPIELVAISKGYAYNSSKNEEIHEWDLEERPHSTEKYEFFNVLWVEWNNGIAYRKALGRVNAEVWLAQDLENISLVLG